MEIYIVTTYNIDGHGAGGESNIAYIGTDMEKSFKLYMDKMLDYIKNGIYILNINLKTWRNCLKSLIHKLDQLPGLRLDKLSIS